MCRNFTAFIAHSNKNKHDTLQSYATPTVTLINTIK